MDFYIGDEAQSRSKIYNVTTPIRHAQVENWDLMERMWEQSIYQYLRVEPENHNFVLVSFCWPCVISVTHIWCLDGSTFEPSGEPRVYC